MDVLPIRAESRSTSQQRLPSKRRPPGKLLGLDWLRAVAAVGVVVLHACVPYVRHPMPGLAWPVRDGSSVVVSAAFWWIELFIMPIFLVLAGLLAVGTLQRRGAGGLVKQRARRLLVPLLFGMIVILPADLHVWVLGWVTDGLVEPVKMRSFKFSGQIDKDLWGLSHLWFVQYLILYICLLAVASSIGKRFRIPLVSTRFGSWSTSRWIALLVGIGSAVLVFRPEVVWGFQHSFWPVPSKFLYSGLFFLLGVVLANHDPNLRWLSNHSQRLWPAAMCVSVAAVTLGQWHLGGSETPLADTQLASDPLAIVLLAVLTCGSATLLSCAMIGTAVARVHRLSIAVRYLAAASFWVYIVHHPILGLIHIDLRLLFPQMSPIAKTILSVGLTMGVSLCMYEGLVRKTLLGRWLGLAWEFPNRDDAVLPIGKPLPAPARRHAKAA